MSEDDILRAIGKLKALGNGFHVVKIGRQKLVRSVPGELNTDKSALLKLAQGTGHVSRKQLAEVLMSINACIAALDPSFFWAMCWRELAWPLSIAWSEPSAADISISF